MIDLPLTANSVPSSLILFNLMMEMIHLSEASVITRVTQRIILENGILHSHRREDFTFYITTGHLL
jgi:hypothetical protein